MKAHSTDFVFFAGSIGELGDTSRHVSMAASDLRLLNPLTGTAPLFRNDRDRQLTIALHRSRALLSDESAEGWGIKPVLMFMVNASMKHHRTAEELEAAGLRSVDSRYVSETSSGFLFTKARWSECSTTGCQY